MRSNGRPLPDNDRLAGQERSLRVSQPFRRLAYDARRQAGGIGGLFQLERVPLPDGRGDLGGVGWYVQEPAPPGGQMRVHARRHDPAAVGGLVRREEERVVEHQRMRGRGLVEGRVPECARVEAMDGLAQVQFEVLLGAAAVPVEGDGRDAGRHDRDADAGTEAVHRGHDWILAGD
jgi:hypothetical protein